MQQNSDFGRRCRFARSFTFAVASVFSLSIHAATLTVTDLDGGFDSTDGQCSLSEAIDNANADAALHSDCPTGSGDDSIILQVDVSIANATNNHFFVGPTAFPTINGGVEIEGGGHSIQRTGNEPFRIFHVAGSGRLTLKNVHVLNGHTPQVSAPRNLGAGVLNQGSLTINRSTLSGHTTEGGDGAAIFNDDSASLSVVNSTLSQNSASLGGQGGAIYNNRLATTTLRHATLSDNNATAAGGVLNFSLATLVISNTIIAGSTGGDCTNFGSVTNLGTNIIESADNDCGISVLNLDPALGSLQDNGGPAPTHALLLGSPALNTAETEQCNHLAVGNTDQRGIPRPQGSQCDIGAFELGLGSIGDFVWDDLDIDGIQDPLEPGIPGVTIELLQAGASIDTATTDATGSYIFEDLPTGDYQIRVLSPAGFAFISPRGAGGNPAVDSDVDAAGESSVFSLAEGQDDTSIDAALAQFGSIGDRLWLDGNSDGAENPAEVGIAGVTLVLKQGSTTVRTVVTDANGNYLFGSIPPGNYVVLVDVSTLPPGLVQTFDADGLATPHQSVLSVGLGETNLDQDFGYRSFPDLRLTKEGVGTAEAGEVIAYTLGYENLSIPVTGVKLNEVVPTNTVFDAALSTAGWNCTPDVTAGSGCVFELGALDSGESGLVVFAVKVGATLPAGVDEVINTATISDDLSLGPDSNPVDNSGESVTVISAAPDLVLNMTSADSSDNGVTTIAYTLDFRNDGTQGATGVSIEEAIPAKTSLSALQGSTGWVCVPDESAGSNCVFPIGALPAGTAGAVVFAVDLAPDFGDDPSGLFNTASVFDDGTNGADLDATDNTDTEGVPIPALDTVAIIALILMLMLSGLTVLRRRV